MRSSVGADLPLSRLGEQGTATTYMSIDSERVSDSLEYLHEMCSSFLPVPRSPTIASDFSAFAPTGAAALSLIIACVLLRFEARWAVITPLLIILLSLACTSTFSIAIIRSYTHRLT